MKTETIGDLELRRALRAALRNLSRDSVDEEVLENTPDRFQKALVEMAGGYAQDPEEILSKTFDVQYDEMVVVEGIEFTSLCEHHLLPFEGIATVGYIPRAKVVGLSKIPRLVQCYARRFQVQERMTRQIADAMQKHLDPAGVGVLIRSRHSCMGARGIRSRGEMVTSALLGVMRDRPDARQEFLELARSK